MTIRNKLLLTLSAVCSLNILQASDDKYFDSSLYFLESLQKVEEKYLESPQEIDDKVKLVTSIGGVLFDFQMTSEKEEFYAYLKETDKYIKMLEKGSLEVFNYLYEGSFTDKHAYVCDGHSTFIYRNSYHQQKRLSDEERDCFYAEELSRTKNVKMLAKELVTKESLEAMIPGITYNFALGLNNQMFFSYEQCYNFRNELGEKIINTPNHTLLAGNEPVFSAGSLTLRKVGDKKLYFISNSSGHFHPLPESLEHPKKYLTNLGVPGESIISVGVCFEKIKHKVEKRRVKSIDIK